MKKRLARKKRMAPPPKPEGPIMLPAVAPSLMLWAYREKPFYIAVSAHGYGVDQIPAIAIRLAQSEVPAKAKPSQMLLYQAADFIEPIGWKDGEPGWPNGTKPKLVGMTSTHRGFRQSPR